MIIYRKLLWFLVDKETKAESSYKLIQEPLPRSVSHLDHGSGNHRALCPSSLAENSLLSTNDTPQRPGHVQEQAWICCPTDTVSCVFSFSPLVPNQAVLDDKAAKLNPTLCRRPSGRFHVTHLVPAEMHGGPELKQREVTFSGPETQGRYYPSLLISNVDGRLSVTQFWPYHSQLKTLWCFFFYVPE
jgi:hypothetical protein